MSLLKNSFTNLLGAAIPALVAMPALGYMARELDAVLFGAAMLIWALVGYAGIFDVGLGKSVVRQIAMSSSKAEKGAIIGSSLLFVFVSGWVACLLVYFFSDYLVLGVFGISASNAEDVLSGVRLSAFCIPLFLMALILQSYLEGVEEFSVFNVYRTISGALSYLAPVLFLYLGGDIFFSDMWPAFLSCCFSFYCFPYYIEQVSLGALEVEHVRVSTSDKLWRVAGY
ncbi:TPA: oligosaccharide flippase family protein [Pseudomonas aeruginosa]|nr:oligosaccharide flippase family protein [Pseudomonas aeruginosa]